MVFFLLKIYQIIETSSVTSQKLVAKQISGGIRYFFQSGQLIEAV